MEYVAERVDWSKRGEYVQSRHGIDPAAADEAVADSAAVWLIPDPASASRWSIRVIGYAESVQEVLTVIVLPADTDPADPPGSGGASTLGAAMSATSACTTRTSREGGYEQGR